MADQLSPAELDPLSRARIVEPVVLDFYNEFVDIGCLECCERIYGNLPPEVASVIIGVQATQVHKEKALWPIYTARGNGLDVEKAIGIGSAVDILWTLSVIMDDILDEDYSRAGGTTAWAVYGREEAERIARTGLTAVLEYLHNIDELTCKLAREYVEIGMRSVNLHKDMGLSVNYGMIVRNYWMRDDFHSAFPFHALYGEDRSLGGRRLIHAFRIFNCGGQILNDFSDFRIQTNGSYRLSDLRGGRITMVLRRLYELVSESDRVLIEKSFGNRNYNPEDEERIVSIINESRFVNTLSSYVEDLYRRARNIIAGYFIPNDLKMVDNWIEYKLRRFRK